MQDFIINAVIWILALYGLIEIIKNIIYIYTYTNFNSDGIYVIIATKNNTLKIINNLQKEYSFVKFLKWKDCKQLIENIKEN